jgi:hypothetical protein
MMALTVFNSLYRRLTADATVAALVGDRIFEGVARTQVYPLITVDVDEMEDDALDAREAPHWNVTIDVVAQTEADRTALAKAVRGLIDRQEWVDGNVTVVSAGLTNHDNTTIADGGNADRLFHVAEMAFEVIAAT